MNKIGVSPKISIGIVVYNGAAHIRCALDSIIKQSYRNIELIVVDGNSTDGTQDILKEYAEHIAVLVSEPDKGIYDAMNKVCSLATGDWLIFLGCDDMLFDTIGDAIKRMTDINTIYHGDVIMRSNGRLYGGKFPRYRLMMQNICHQALFYPGTVYKQYRYGLKYRILADYEYNLKIYALGILFVYIPVVITLYNDKGLSSSGDADFIRDHPKLLVQIFGSSPVLLGKIQLYWVNKYKLLLTSDKKSI